MTSMRLKTAIAYAAAGLGAVLLIFIAPLALLPGYIGMGILFALLGTLLIGLGLISEIKKRTLPLMLLGVAVFTFCVYGLTCRGVGLFKFRSGVAMNGVVTIEDAVSACNATGLKDWELVAYAQSMVAHKISYSRATPWDSPATSFRQGQGYCMQQAQALEQIYKRLGIQCRLVYADKCRFWSTDFTHTVVISHAWLKVKVNGVEKDVCPGSINNFPGFTDFDVLSGERNLKTPFRPLTHIAFVLGNISRDPRNN